MSEIKTDKLSPRTDSGTTTLGDSGDTFLVNTGAKLDINGTELILDADADTSITADTDDQIDIKIAGADDFQFTANKFLVQTGSTIDMNAGELILDADADTSITADTDDQIDIKAGGSDVVTITGSGLGIGVTPESDWENAVDVLQISVGAAIHSYNNDFDNGPYITQNARDVQSGPWKRIGAGYATSMGNYNGVITFQVAGSGSADDEITWTTGLEVLNDGKTRAKNGLLFGTDTAAANALDDYEEGTWTAVVRVGGSGGTDNGDSTGHYVKIGATVWIRAVVPVDSTVVGTGTIFMTGLPFTSEAGSASAISFTVNDRIDTTDIKARVDAGSTNIAFSLVPATTSNTAAGAPHTIIGSGAGKYFYVGGVYSVGS